MAVELNTFDDDSIFEIAKSVQRLRAQFLNLQELVTRLGRFAPTHEIHTGRLQARAGKKYPTKGCVLPTQFTDVVFDETPGNCDQPTIFPWPAKFVSARTYNGMYLPRGTDVLIVKVAGKEGRRWWIIPVAPGNCFSMCGTMMNDRSRETDDAGLPFGRATARINDLAGDPQQQEQQVGDIVEVRFCGRLWLGAVAGCDVIADYCPAEKKWIVKDCQESTMWIRFYLTQDRPPTDPDVDVDAIILREDGVANAVFPNDCGAPTAPAPQGPQYVPDLSKTVVSCRGYVKYRWDYFPDLPSSSYWTPVASTTRGCSDGCQALRPTTPGPSVFHMDPKKRPVKIVSCTPIPDPEPPPPTPEPGPDPAPPNLGGCIKVRFDGLDYPRSLQGAIGYAALDVDYGNTTSNSGMRYHVKVCDQMTKTVTSSLLKKMCGDDAQVADVEVSDFFPHSQKPLNITSISNPHGHYGMVGDKITAKWSEAAEQWQVIDVDKHPELLAMELQMLTDSSGCTSLTAKEAMCAVEYCTPPTTKTLLSYKTEAVIANPKLTVDKGTSSGSGAGEGCGTDAKLSLTYDIKTALLVCTAGSSGSTDLGLTLQDIVADFSFDASGCPVWTNDVAIVLGSCGESTESATCEPVCPESSGSGS